MKTNKFILFAVSLAFCAFSCSKPDNAGTGNTGTGSGEPAKPELPLEFTVIGDSYSTYEGWNNANNNGFADEAKI